MVEKRPKEIVFLFPKPNFHILETFTFPVETQLFNFTYFFILNSLNNGASVAKDNVFDNNCASVAKDEVFDKNGASVRGKGTPGRHLLIRLICPPNRNLSILPKRFRQKCLSSSSSPFQLKTSLLRKYVSLESEFIMPHCPDKEQVPLPL